MTQRVQDFMKEHLSKVDEVKVKQILKLRQFKAIVTEQLQEFKTFYLTQIKKEAPIYARKASEIYLKTALGKEMKSQEQIAYEQVDQLNNDIFNESIEDIKQFMTIAILDTQGLMEDIDLTKNPVVYNPSN